MSPMADSTKQTAKPPHGACKIGEASWRLGISVHGLRRYEREGLAIPFRSQAGTRWYSTEDIQWIQTIRDLLARGLNFAGIRHLLAQIPCWTLKPCSPEERENCPLTYLATTPCWSAPDRLCPEELKDCYHCAAYRRATEFVNLKTVADIVPR